MFAFTQLQRLAVTREELKKRRSVVRSISSFSRELSIALQLVVHIRTGSGFAGFMRGQDFATFPKIGPKAADIPILSKLGQSRETLQNVDIHVVNLRSQTLPV